MATWHRVAAVSDCPPGASLECVAGERVVALFNVGGSFHALDGICPHQGGPLGKGIMTGCVVTCPWHGWQFDVETGQNEMNHSLVQQQFSVKVQEGDVWVSFDVL